MTAHVPSADAVSHKHFHWHVINWRQVTGNVRRLQARIVKATQAKKWRKVRSLQHLLTHSFSGKALAVRRVTENQGRATPGVDKILWDSPEKKAAAVHDLKRRGYKPLPLRRVYIPKRNGRLRPLSIPTMRDRAMQALHLLALDPIAETLADVNSYGFRRERSTADAIQQCFLLLSKRRSAQWILEADIKSCFDCLNHEWLMAHIPTDKVILKQWLEAGYVDKSTLRPTNDGTPQGSIISPVLMNMALDGLERKLRAAYPQRKDDKGALVNLVRYADDFIITGRTKEVLEGEVKALVQEHLAERGLELSNEKTRVTHIAEGFDFLGQSIRKYDGTMLIKPSRKNVKAYLRKVRELINASKQAAAGELVKRLNPLVQGWANYHRHVASKRTYSKTGCAIFKSLWQWALRRHARKSKSWVKAKYFTTQRGNSWVFFGERAKPDGTVYPVQLVLATDTPIRRHIKVRGEANPYDPAWETYFERRLDVKMEANLTGRRQLLRLWKEQEGLCPTCRQKITKITGWHSHHIIWKSRGGADGNSNRVLLHPFCHTQIHCRRLEVAKPRHSR